MNTNIKSLVYFVNHEIQLIKMNIEVNKEKNLGSK